MHTCQSVYQRIKELECWYVGLADIKSEKDEHQTSRASSSSSSSVSKERRNPRAAAGIAASLILTETVIPPPLKQPFLSFSVSRGLTKERNWPKKLKDENKKNGVYSHSIHSFIDAGKRRKRKTKGSKRGKEKRWKTQRESMRGKITGGIEI